MTVVIGTAGHIDHGKTTLLRALTGIDADRLPEERRRGMTIDVGYAHLALDDGTELDFVDVPGHDKLVGNMLVGAGEIDAALLVVAADDGPRAQTLEHLALLDALGIRDGVAVVTKADSVEPDRVAAVIDDVRRLLGGTTLAGAPVLAVSGVTGEGLEALRAALVGVRDAVTARSEDEAPGRRPWPSTGSSRSRGAAWWSREHCEVADSTVGRRSGPSPATRSSGCARCRSTASRSSRPVPAGRHSTSPGSTNRCCIAASS